MNLNLDIKYKSISANYYVNVFFNHREFEKAIKEKYNLSDKVTLLDNIPVFGKKTYVSTKDTEFSKSILSDYFILSEMYSGYNSIDKMKDFVEFIRFIEKVEMFENDPDNQFGIFCEEKDKTKKIYLILKNYKVQMIMEETEIEDDMFEQSILDKAIYGTNHVILVTLNITRTTGKNMSNTFTFIYGDEPDFNDVSDELLLNNVMEDVNKKMLELFDFVMGASKASADTVSVKERWRHLYQYGFKIQ